jgi:hypothetical protein
MREKAMNEQQHKTAQAVLIGRDYWYVPVRVDVRAYLKFSRQMDAQLRRLVVRWAHAASPSARGVPLTRQLMGTPVPPTT